VFWVIIIIIAIKSLGKKNILKDGVSQLSNKLQEVAIENTKKYITEHPNDPIAEQLEDQIEEYEESQVDKERKRLSNQQHSVGGAITAGPSTKKKGTLQKNYYEEKHIVKDALTKTNRNPYSLDGK
jgi:hypothetical protein